MMNWQQVWSEVGLLLDAASGRVFFTARLETFYPKRGTRLV
jgi:hypothetical protein